MELSQRKRRKTIRSYLAARGSSEHFQIEFKFWHYTTNKFETNLLISRCKMKLQIDNRISGLKKKNLSSFQTHYKRRKGARASTTSHHTSLKELFSSPNLYRPWFSMLGTLAEIARKITCEMHSDYIDVFVLAKITKLFM